MTEIFKKDFSYKLEVNLQPNWYNLYKRVSVAMSEKEWEEKIKKSDDSDMWGKGYRFIEYYDSVSGLTSRFVVVSFKNTKSLTYPVDEFSDSGFVFGSDRMLGSKEDKDETPKSLNTGKLAFEVTEDSIRNNIFDKHIGGKSIPEKGDYLFTFPLYEVFNFLFALGRRFDETERCPVIKWPDHIEKRFKELGITYKTNFDYEPTEFKIEEHDKQLYEKLGKPRVALYGDNEGYFTSNEVFFYNVKLKIFRPNENDRIASKN